MKAWGSGDERVVAKIFELLFHAGLSQDQLGEGLFGPPALAKQGAAGTRGGAFSRSSMPLVKVSPLLGTSTQ